MRDIDPITINASKGLYAVGDAPYLPDYAAGLYKQLSFANDVKVALRSGDIITQSVTMKTYIKSGGRILAVVEWAFTSSQTYHTNLSDPSKRTVPAATAKIRTGSKVSGQDTKDLTSGIKTGVQQAKSPTDFTSTFVPTTVCAPFCCSS